MNQRELFTREDRPHCQYIHICQTMPNTVLKQVSQQQDSISVPSNIQIKVQCEVLGV